MGRSPGGGHGNPLQYSCLKNPMDRGAWRAIVHGGHKESDTTEQQTFLLILFSFEDLKEYLGLPWWCVHACSVALCDPTRLFCPWDFPGKNTEVGYHFLLQGIFPTQVLNTHLLCLLHCRQILYLLRHWGSPTRSSILV